MATQEMQNETAMHAASTQIKYIAVTAFCILFCVAMVVLQKYVPETIGDYLTPCILFAGPATILVASRTLFRGAKLLSFQSLIARVYAVGLTVAYASTQALTNSSRVWPEVQSTEHLFIAIAIIFAVSHICAIVVRRKIWSGFSLL